MKKNADICQKQFVINIVFRLRLTTNNLRLTKIVGFGEM